MESLPYRGSTSDFFRLKPGLIVKSPMKVWEGNPDRERLEEEMGRSISFERRILESLGEYSRIVPYLGAHTQGILFKEASHGGLQTYLDSHNAVIDDSRRCKWSLQAVEAIVYIHSKGVIHSDLRLENFLVYAATEVSLDLWLCDFGGARCDDLGRNDHQIPDDPFFDHRLPWESTPAIDIFSLGSIIYTILTGYWPYREEQRPLVATDEKRSYEAQVQEMFEGGNFPDVSGLRGGEVIKGCWDHQYQTAEEVLLAMNNSTRTNLLLHLVNSIKEIVFRAWGSWSIWAWAKIARKPKGPQSN